MPRNSGSIAITVLTVLPFTIGAASIDPRRGRPLSILATMGGYNLRAVSPQGDEITASCQRLRKDAWTFLVSVSPAKRNPAHIKRYAKLTLANDWVYRLRDHGEGIFAWEAPGTKAFSMFLDQLNGMGWSDRYVSVDLGINFYTHGSDDSGTIAAFKHLCRLPGNQKNAY